MLAFYLSAISASSIFYHSLRLAWMECVPFSLIPTELTNHSLCRESVTQAFHIIQIWNLNWWKFDHSFRRAWMECVPLSLITTELTNHSLRNEFVIQAFHLIRIWNLNWRKFIHSLRHHTIAADVHNILIFH
jgi:hypothetical protein